MKRAILVFSLLPTLAFAQAQPDTAKAVPAPSPTAIGTPHTCGQKYYPPVATRLGLEGSATLIFRIGTDGIPKDIAIAKSTGSLDLDYASVNCASTWSYKPAEKDGHPIEVSWSAKVTWQLNYGSPPSTPPIPTAAPHTCSDRPMSSGKAQVPTILSFVIGIDGNVKNLQILQTSGDRISDLYGVTCVSAWRFEPAKNKDQGVEVEEFATLPWPL